MSIIGYLFIAGVVILVTYLVNNHIKNRRFWKLLEDFYGNKPDPIFGNALQLGSNAEKISKRAFVTFERAGYTTYKFAIGNKVFVNICDPDTCEVMLSNTKEISKMKEYSYFKDWLGDGLLLSTGNKWRQRRKILTPTFHFKILEQFVKVFNDNGNILIDQLSKETDKLFDVFPFIKAFTQDVICETAMGVSVHAQENKHSEYVEAVHSMCTLLNDRFRSPLKRFNWFFALTNDNAVYKRNKSILHKMTKDVIQTRKVILKDQIEKIKRGEVLEDEAEKDIGRKKKIVFLDLLLLSRLPDGSFLSDEDVREETDTFMFEGHDTSTAAISFIIYELARNPQVQQKLLEEIMSTLGHPSVDITYENLQNMKYIEMVIKEGLRLYPPVPRYGRLLESDLEMPGGKIIPGGCTVIVDAFCLGRNPRHYENPEKFDPGRFLPENLVGRHPYVFLPFSAGLRNCIGQKFAMLQLKTVLSKLILNYELISGGDEFKVRLASEVILKSVNGVQIYIKKRETV